MCVLSLLFNQNESKIISYSNVYLGIVHIVQIMMANLSAFRLTFLDYLLSSL